jgi:ribosomal-protein-alanine N-acetyltransferase
MKIKVEDFFIRSYEYSDKEALVKYANNPKVSRLLRDQFPYPYTKSDAKLWLRNACNQNPETNFVIANEEEMMGAIGINLQYDVYKYSAEIGYWLGEPFWGKGIATSAVKALTEFAFTNFLLSRIYAHVFEGNIASEKVLLKAGYVKEATLKNAVFKGGKFLDQYIYAILKEDFMADK